ncbi:MAG: phosphatase PAP2 family protein [Lachnospiraceae bacterium]|nr:phosphatase PAP2 family protein [Lachnospiraceae bacterium]
MKKIGSFLYKYRHAWTLLYLFIYMPWFVWLETHVDRYHVIYSPIDDLIPFCEYFIVPYLLWFGYVAIVMAYLLFHSKEDFYRASAFLFIGMSIALLICTVWPNGQNLRVDVDADKNVFCRLVARLYSTDTHTNVFPSIHVLNSIGIHIAVCRNKTLSSRKPVVAASGILMVLICMSTVFLKQHSVVDVAGGIALALVMYILVYMPHDLRVLIPQDNRLRPSKRPQ